jgi:hypothetical protein
MGKQGRCDHLKSGAQALLLSGLPPDMNVSIRFDIVTSRVTPTGPHVAPVGLMTV